MIATVIAGLESLRLSERLSNLMESLDLTAQDLCIYCLAMFLVFWICAIARTSIRGARRSRQGLTAAISKAGPTG